MSAAVARHVSPAARRGVPRVGVVLVLATALLAGCGWHLRGAQSVSLDKRVIALDDQTGSRHLRRAVSDVLGNLGARVTDADAPSPDARLVLSKDGFSRRTLASGGRNGTTEYELSYHLSFQVQGPEGEAWSQTETVTTSDSYEVNENNVLGGESVRADLERTLREQGARLMAARMQATLDKHLEKQE